MRGRRGDGERERVRVKKVNPGEEENSLVKNKWNIITKPQLSHTSPEVQRRNKKNSGMR